MTHPSPGPTTDPEPFRVDVPDEDVADLRARLRATRWVDDFGNDDWAYGVERSWLQDLVRYWADEFDWRAVESAMNAVPHYRAVVDGLPVHFQHLRGTGPDPMPLVLTHGWPWSFWDWKDVVGPLADPAGHGGDPADAFDVVVPSLPGFGFSSPLRETGVGCRRVAQAWDTLMHDVLGYPRYAAAGGDWGSKVTGELGNLYPERVAGVYMTLLSVPGAPPPADPATRFTGPEAWMADRTAAAAPLITAHLAVHRHDPQTLAYALNDSPVGLAAWLWQRRRSWSDPASWDDPDRDFLCTLASLYWFTGTIGTSMRFYRENFGPDVPGPVERSPQIPVPTAYGVAPHDVLMMPRREAEAATDLRRWTLFPRGGHFGPHEIPADLVTEYREFFRPLR